VEGRTLEFRNFLNPSYSLDWNDQIPVESTGMRQESTGMRMELTCLERTIYGTHLGFRVRLGLDLVLGLRNGFLGLD
jgi:hypothetical protein